MEDDPFQRYCKCDGGRHPHWIRAVLLSVVTSIAIISAVPVGCADGGVGNVFTADVDIDGRSHSAEFKVMKESGMDYVVQIGDGDSSAIDTTLAGHISIGGTVSDGSKTYYVEKVGDGAFNGCSLTSVTLPEGLKVIGERAFSECVSLISIELPSTLEAVGNEAFDRCLSLGSISLPDGLKTVGNGAFYNCESLANIDVPDTMTSIGDSAFGGCSVRELSLSAGMTFIGTDAFCGCLLLTSVTVAFSSDYSGGGILMGTDNLGSWKLAGLDAGQIKKVHIAPEGAVYADVSEITDTRVQLTSGHTISLAVDAVGTSGGNFNSGDGAVYGADRAGLIYSWKGGNVWAAGTTSPPDPGSGPFYGSWLIVIAAVTALLILAAVSTYAVHRHRRRM